MYSNDTFIAKPICEHRGNGIFIFNNIEEFDRRYTGEEYIIQKYVDNPYLLNNKKWDLKIHVLVDGVSP